MLEINVNVMAPDIVNAITLLVNAVLSKDEEPAAPAVAAIPTAPATASVATAAPAAPVAAAPTYTVAQVAKAGADLMSANPALQPALVELIHRYGAQTVQDLPQDRLGAFATELRQMGAKL